jgi:hypothetical protein
LRIKPVAKTQKFTIAPKKEAVKEQGQGQGQGQGQEDGPVCRKEEGCIVCSS